MRKWHVECKPDEQLLKSLGYAKGNIKHHNDKGRVCKTLQGSENMIGMIDEDPGSAQPKYLSTLKLESEKHGIRNLIDTKTGNKIIVLCPRLEEWIIKVCKDHNVIISDFGLPDIPNRLHGSINSRLAQFDNLIKHLTAKNNKPIDYLKELIK